MNKNWLIFGGFIVGMLTVASSAFWALGTVHRAWYFLSVLTLGILSTLLIKYWADIEKQQEREERLERGDLTPLLDYGYPDFSLFFTLCGICLLVLVSWVTRHSKADVWGGVQLFTFCLLGLGFLLNLTTFGAVWIPNLRWPRRKTSAT